MSSSAGKDENRGTKDAPVASFAKAIALARGDGGLRRIYACAEAFDESVSVPPGITIYGGLACTDGWVYDQRTRTTLRPKADAMALEAIPLKLGEQGASTHSPDEIRLEDFDVIARDGVQGGSSVAVTAQRVHVNLARCTFEAGNGSDGVAGATHNGAGYEGASGRDGKDACSANEVEGGKGPENTCDVGSSRGGNGGNGLEYWGDDGGYGVPKSSGSNGGEGQPEKADAPIQSCMPGTIGDEGAQGAPGLGGRGIGALQQLVTEGIIGERGKSGTFGTPGQGGGGGGGSKGSLGNGKCTSNDAGKGGPSGGSGGSGGCGGLGGNGGIAGGSSIALVSFNATFTFQDVTLTAKNGGKGGDGGPGQEGGKGGAGGDGGSSKGLQYIKPGCLGGTGGQGGIGGKGGGGVGGHSLGIAYKGATPSEGGVTITFGAAGPGGTGEGENGTGETGQASTVQSFLD